MLSNEHFRLAFEYGKVLERRSAERREKYQQDSKLIKRYHDDSLTLDPDEVAREEKLIQVEEERLVDHGDLTVAYDEVTPAPLVHSNARVFKLLLLTDQSSVLIFDSNSPFSIIELNSVHQLQERLPNLVLASPLNWPAFPR